MKRFFYRGLSAVRRLRAAASTFGRVLLGGNYARLSYSQYGEDMVLQAVFARYPSTYSGLYVDVGAHHPMRFSNTRYFYELGWSGICVDPLPSSAKLFARWRPRDIFLQAGVAETEGEMTYYLFDEPALNTFSKKIASENPSPIVAREKIQVYPLCKILADNLSGGSRIDFLSVDVEGMDIEVLRSNSWSDYRPYVVLIEETMAVTFADINNIEIVIFMKQQGYQAFARTPSGVFFIDTRSAAYDGSSYLRYTNVNPAGSGAKGKL